MNVRQQAIADLLAAARGKKVLYDCTYRGQPQVKDEGVLICADSDGEYLVVEHQNANISYHCKGDELLRLYAPPQGLHYQAAGVKPDRYYLFLGPKEVAVPAIVANKCDCGAEKCKTTHAHWCSKNKGV